MTVAVAIINFNTAYATLRCLEAVRHIGNVCSTLVLDNASEALDIAKLSAVVQGIPGVALVRSECNLGFAAGSNFLVQQILAQTVADKVLLINSDAVPFAQLVNMMAPILDRSPMVGLVGGRVHRLEHPDQPDSLGITLYGSLMASNRLSVDDPYLGPTGGCVLMSRKFIEDAIASHGHLFDPNYFCYWEDTDLVLRARLLGYEPGYVDTLVALHEGQASTGSRFNSFIAYHGLRNAIWTFFRCMPVSLMWRRGFSFLLANLMSVARLVVTGQWRLLFRVYADALRGLPRCLRSRQRIMASRRIPGKQLLPLISEKFYEPGYIPAAIRRMFSRRSAV